MQERDAVRLGVIMRSGLAAAALGILLAGCELGTPLDDSQTLLGGESRAEREAREAREAELRNKVPVASVRRVEIGRTRNGYLITAFGTAPALGYSLPSLRPRRDGAPGGDGFIEYDFVAAVPAKGLELPEGNARARALRADTLVREDTFRRARGIRILAQQGGVQVPFARQPNPTAETPPSE